MKTAIFYGSPHADGHTAALLRALTDALGGEITRFDAYSGEILPCRDCGACRNTAGCVIGDRGAEALRAVREADCIVIAAPLHFSSLPGMLSAMASRMQYLWMRRQAGEDPLGGKKRCGVLCLTGGGSGGPRRALEEGRCFLRLLGADTVWELTSLKTDSIPAAADPAVPAAVRQIAAEIRARADASENGRSAP